MLLRSLLAASPLLACAPAVLPAPASPKEAPAAALLPELDARPHHRHLARLSPPFSAPTGARRAGGGEPQTLLAEP